MRKKILYISTNDGSDTRINKEVQTLAKSYEIIFLGVGDESNFFLKEYCNSYYLAKGKRNHPITVLKQFSFAARVVLQHKDLSIHIVNEQLAVFFYPLLLLRHTVLDVFDSIFLTKGIQPNYLIWLKKIVYFPANKIVVTDENRRTLMPSFLQKKLHVIPNYPFMIKSQSSAENISSEDTLNILFFGWLGMSRGGKQAKELLSASENIKIIMIGWFSDNECKELIKHPRVDYRGVMPQEEALAIAANEADYMLCLYEPKNLNTINASPNKIYDSIQTYTPVIINREVKVAQLVEDINTGIVIDNYYHPFDLSFIELLKKRRNNFSFSEELAEKYTWESLENSLIDLHKL